MRACVDNPPKGLWDHSGLRKRFTFHLHMKGVDPVLSRKFSRDAAELYALRRAADYFDALVEEEEARRALFKAEEIVKFVEALYSRFDRVYQEMSGLRGEFENRFRAVDQRFMWLYGLLVAVLIGVAGLWFK